MTEYDPRWYAKLYDRLGREYLELPFTRGTEQEASFLAEELELAPGARVLDVGCGTGRHAIELAKRGCEVTGVDASPRLLEIALQEAKKSGVVINFVNADAREMRFARKFHAAISICNGTFGILESDRENDRVLLAVRDALEPGGKFALGVTSLVHIAANLDRFPGFDAETCYTISVEKCRYESGRVEECAIRDRAYTLPEIAARLRASGFRLLAAYGCSVADFGRHPLNAARKEMLLHSERSPG